MNYWRENTLGQINVPEILVSDEWDEEDDNRENYESDEKNSELIWY